MAKTAFVAAFYLFIWTKNNNKQSINIT